MAALLWTSAQRDWLPVQIRLPVCGVFVQGCLPRISRPGSWPACPRLRIGNQISLYHLKSSLLASGSKSSQSTLISDHLHAPPTPHSCAFRPSVALPGARRECGLGPVPMPEIYNRAKTALMECERLDVAKEMTNQAMALAVYAKQANNDELVQLAARIKAQANRRCGELLMAIEPSKGGDSSLFHAREGTHPSVETRKQVAEDSGLSDWQRKQAIRMAKIPEEEFEHMMDEIKVPTMEKMLRGKHKRNDVERKKPSLNIPPSSGIDIRAGD